MAIAAGIPPGHRRRRSVIPASPLGQCSDSVRGRASGQGCGWTLENWQPTGLGIYLYHALTRTPRSGHLHRRARMVGQSFGRQPSPTAACSLAPVPGEQRRAPPHDREGGDFAGNRAVTSQFFTIVRLLVTEKAPDTPLARMPAIFLSASLSTTPSRVTWPFLTIMRMGLITPISYFCSGPKP